MRYIVKLVIDIPYAYFRENTVQITTDSFNSLITETIPERAFTEMEELKETVWKKIGWKHVNMKFYVCGQEIEYVFDLEKCSRAAVYFSDEETGKLLACSEPGWTFEDERDLSEETARRALEAKVIRDFSH